ncbi:hypothetical protein HHI36_003877, partial [Cryptolaemus montrouzieri]
VMDDTAPRRRLTRQQLRFLLNQAWGRSETSGNAILGFRAAGVFPLNPGAIPEYDFSENFEQLDERNIEHAAQVPLASDPGQSTSFQTVDQPTPTRLLNESALPVKRNEVRKRAKQSILLTSEDHIDNRKMKENEKEKKEKCRKNQK